MDLRMGRNDDGSKSPDGYKSMGPGRDRSHFRWRVKVKVSTEKKMRFDAKISRVNLTENEDDHLKPGM